MRSVWIQHPETGELVDPAVYYREKRERELRHRTGNPIMITDAYSAGFRSPVDGTMIYSRAQNKAHNERNGVIDVGNDPAFTVPQRKPPPKMESSESFIRDIYDADSVECIPDD